MKCLQVLSLIIILAFSSAILAEVRKDLKVAKTQFTTNADFPNPFRPIIDIFKKIFGVNPKIIACPVANVEDLILSEVEILISKTQTIQIHTIAKDPENDLLTYSYVVSVGKIIGKGEKVIWDLSGVKPGTYTITAAVDDGCGFCGKTQTKTVIVK